MKLLHKSSLYYIAWLIPLFVVSGFVMFWAISSEIAEDVDHALHARGKALIHQLEQSDSIDARSFRGDDFTLKRLSRKPKHDEQFSDTVIQNHHSHKFIPYRKLTSYFKKNGHYIGIEITQSQVRSHELIEGISQTLALMFCLLLAGLLLINSILSRKLWRPFYESLTKLHTVSFAQKQPPTFDSSSTKEFKELNTALNKMTAKMFSDYESQKQFTENASHEMQTPLAVIKSKTGMLLQTPSMSEEALNLVSDVEQSVGKLAYINRSLLLLAKLENRQFDETTAINISDLLDKVVVTYEDRIALKHIQIDRKQHANVVLNLNPTIAEILFSNLIQNAIRYNVDENGIIRTEVNPDNITISNTGAPLQGDPGKIFDRFTKFNSNTESLGLGLSIVKQICDYYNLDIQYRFHDDMHHFVIYFPA